MLTRLVGRGSMVADLKAGLDSSSASVKGIAHRVANASNGDFQGALQDAGAAGAPGGEAVDLEKEMVSLAEEQIRFDAASQLLQKVYQQIRMGVRER